MLMEEVEGKAKQLCKKQQGWKESWKELLWQEPPISIPSGKIHRGGAAPGCAGVGVGGWATVGL